VQDPGTTRITFEENVDAAREEVSAKIGVISMADKLMVEHRRLGQIGVPSRVNEARQGVCITPGL
jgi:hypothetical protein